MAALSVPMVEGFIKQLGLAPTKAKNVVAMSNLLMERHGGGVPNTFDELEALPGVGHKTASVVMSQIFGALAFPVDTHIHRLAQRWGLTTGASVEQTEADLKVLIPPERWRDAHLQIIYFGREHCPAKAHDPSECPICAWAAVAPFNRVGASPARPGQKPTSEQVAGARGDAAANEVDGGGSDDKPRPPLFAQFAASASGASAGGDGGDAEALGKARGRGAAAAAGGSREAAKGAGDDGKPPQPFAQFAASAAGTSAGGDAGDAEAPGKTRGRGAAAAAGARKVKADDTGGAVIDDATPKQPRRGQHSVRGR
ncbi:hypothetical protein FOA52_014926 [Chlamydomonas sp. UWO 241]|nr:hypothetical protein FOA52_014926 [Chlamydomonas sp. UWO 241]